ncbi:hypothetical protein KL925_001208 [Ogataea polymorpha]|nr:hypothetical protein KL936_001207 [Ogataea polymorpha]KAG7897030.1 hypothetical protein KL908_000432 [Ogataea polymorpha]KAG7903165.1 hypothetical protein KL935_000697 [Ogataea polymorpha]KAG7912230.1 hypothetical protein KL906_000434 [Ogataea polymorpha]KAG7920007.1 hypothetical protein KL927_000687 [Ogataea polymorpha]
MCDEIRAVKRSPELFNYLFAMSHPLPHANKQELEQVARFIFCHGRAPDGHFDSPLVNSAIRLHMAVVADHDLLDSLQPALFTENRPLALEYHYLRLLCGQADDSVYEAALELLEQLTEQEKHQFPAALIVCNFKYLYGAYLAGLNKYAAALPYLLDTYSSSQVDFFAGPKPDFEGNFRLAVQALLLIPYGYAKLDALRQLVGQLDNQPFAVDKTVRTLLANMKNEQVFPIDRHIVSQIVPSTRVDDAVRLLIQYNIIASSKTFRTIKIATLVRILGLQIPDSEMLDSVLGLVSERKLDAAVDEVDMTVHFARPKRPDPLFSALQLLDKLS